MQELINSFDNTQSSEELVCFRLFLRTLQLVNKMSQKGTIENEEDKLFQIGCIFFIID